jgi:hypothetical protein
LFGERVVAQNGQRLRDSKAHVGQVSAQRRVPAGQVSAAATAHAGQVNVPRKDIALLAIAAPISWMQFQ